MNLDPKTVDGFGEEWSRFDQSEVPERELAELFAAYFEVFPWHELPEGAQGFDMGCGSGRWARFVAPRVGTLHCIDASPRAVDVARRNLRDRDNCRFHVASVDDLPLDDASQDFGYSLGVLHHIPDTAAGLEACVRKLKPGAPFLVYLYYAFDNKPGWYRRLWRVSDRVRRVISALPSRAKSLVTSVIAVTIYWPLARTAKALERLGRNVESFPLSYYRTRSFYTMRTDALDRFGTRLERRFTAEEIKDLMASAGLTRIRLSETPPYWCALGYRPAEASDR